MRRSSLSSKVMVLVVTMVAGLQSRLLHCKVDGKLMMKESGRRLTLVKTNAKGCVGNCAHSVAGWYATRRRQNREEYQCHQESGCVDVGNKALVNSEEVEARDRVEDA